jgi:predicted enzyme related to lactoylglutathione lyase
MKTMRMGPHWKYSNTNRIASGWKLTESTTKDLEHIASQADSVEEVLNRLIEHGGKPLGEVVTREYEGIGTLTVVYASDPEGNYIEIQNWS